MRFLKPLIYTGGRLLNSVINPWGYELRPFTDDSDGFLVSAKYVERQNQHLMREFITAIPEVRFFKRAQPERVLEIIREFRELYKSAPGKQTHGGSGFNSCLNLYLVVRLLDPDVILESGVFKGMTSWILRKAAPRASLHCFDLSFSHLKYRDSTISYYEQDIMSVELNFKATELVFAFFDDHVSQAKRITDARKLNATHIVFDDDYETERLYVDKCPAVPTEAMLMDEEIEDGEVIEWRGYGDNHSHKYDLDSAKAAKNEVAVYRKLPAFGTKTGYRASCMCYLELHSKESS